MQREQKYIIYGVDLGRSFVFVLGKYAMVQHRKTTPPPPVCPQKREWMKERERARESGKTTLHTAQLETMSTSKLCTLSTVTAQSQHSHSTSRNAHTDDPSQIETNKK